MGENSGYPSRSLGVDKDLWMIGGIVSIVCHIAQVDPLYLVDELLEFGR